MLSSLLVICCDFRRFVLFLDFHRESGGPRDLSDLYYLQNKTEFPEDIQAFLVNFVSNKTSSNSYRLG